MSAADLARIAGLAMAAGVAAVASAAAPEALFAPVRRVEPAAILTLDDEPSPLRVRVVGSAGRAESWGGFTARYDLGGMGTLRWRRERSVSLSDGVRSHETSLTWALPLAASWQLNARASRGEAAPRDNAVELFVTLRF